MNKDLLLKKENNNVTLIYKSISFVYFIFYTHTYFECDIMELYRKTIFNKKII